MPRSRSQLRARHRTVFVAIVVAALAAVGLTLQHCGEPQAPFEPEAPPAVAAPPFAGEGARSDGNAAAPHPAAGTSAAAGESAEGTAAGRTPQPRDGEAPATIATGAGEDGARTGAGDVVLRPPFVRGRVVDTLDSPVSGCEVVLQPAASKLTLQASAEGAGVLAQGRTDAHGRFAFSCTSPEPLSLTLVHRAFPPTVAATGFRVWPDRPTELGDLVLHSRPGLVVLLQDQSGTPVEGARLELSPVLTDATLPGPALVAMHLDAVSGTGGRAVFFGVAPGAWWLRIEAPGHATQERLHQQPLDAAEPPVVSVQLLQGHVLRGLTRGPGGEPLANVTVRAFPLARRSEGEPDDSGARAATSLPITWTRSGDGGAYRLSGLAAGPYRVEAECTEWGLHVVPEVSVGPGNERLDLRFAAGRRLTGTVLRGHGPGATPVPGALVLATPEDGWPLFRDGQPWRPRATTDALGQFTLQGLPDGRFRLRVESEAAAPADLGPLRAEASPVPVTIHLEPPFLVRGRVVDAVGRPIAGATIDVVDAAFDGTSHARLLEQVVRERVRRPSATSAGDGTFVLPTVPPGEHRLHVRAAGLAPRTMPTFVAVAGGSHDVGAIALAGGGTVRGTAWTAQGAPASGATVCLDPAEPGLPDAAVTAAADGSFELLAIPAGSYTLSYHFPEQQSVAAAVESRRRTRASIRVEDNGLARHDLRPR